MSEDFAVMEAFFPVLIQSFIRYETVAKFVKNQDAGIEKVPLVVKFSLLKEHYEQIINCEIVTPLIGLKLSYDEKGAVLTVEPSADFIELYENKIMKDVALKKAESGRVRYSKFIKVIE